MSRKWNRKKIHHIFVIAMLMIILQDFIWDRERMILNTWLPVFSFSDSDTEPGELQKLVLRCILPAFAYGMETEIGLQTENGMIHEKNVVQNEHEESHEGTLILDEGEAQLLLEENQTGIGEAEKEREKFEPGNQEIGFQKALVKQQEYNWSYYQDVNALIKEFYAVDATTEADAELLNLDNLLGRDMTIQKNPDSPQILIYHTHSQEGFVDSVAGDDSTTIMGAGELLTQILREEYGYQVIHHKGKFDVESRDYAYSNSLPVLERILKENPTIEVVIDLHRDEMLEGRKLVMELGDRPTARLMFFNGLSHTKEQGDIAYLENPYIQDNLAFSFQMQAAANEYYPGLTRRIYLKGYRYNMHLCPRSLLIELGAQTNTVEEIRNACAPIAHILDLVLSG